MRRSTYWRRTLLGAPLLASLTVAVSLASPAAAKKVKSNAPRAVTGAISHVHGTSALLEGVVNPRGVETTYFFQYGPTKSYGSQTSTANAGNGVANVKVGLTAFPIQAGYHYRLVATNSSGEKGEGADRTVGAGSSRPKLELVKATEPAVYGSPVIVHGVLTGPNSANHRVILQASAFPYLEPFSSVGPLLPTLTDAAGRFSFRLASLLASTQVRAMTLDSLPLISPILTEHVAVRVIFKVRSSGQRGFVRLYGTVSPAEVGARVLFQLLKPIRSTRSEKTTAFATQASTVVKRATRTTSRFSAVVSLRHGGSYRAFVVIRTNGPLVSGSSKSLLIHGAPGTARKVRTKH
ncbi:MAG: hypothetical protein M3Z95_01900 [Actinomycetota bacterium]|nr:hypothetical protein [Actinomycetota bacterium]